MFVVIRYATYTELINILSRTYLGRSPQSVHLMITNNYLCYFLIGCSKILLIQWNTRQLVCTLYI